MKTLSVIFAVTTLFGSSCLAEDITLVVENQDNQIAESEAITLNRGDAAELKFAHHTNNLSDANKMRLAITAGGKTIEVSCVRIHSKDGGETYDTNPIRVAGPAVIKLKLGWNGNNTSPSTGIATFDVHRVGAASEPVPIPQEAGTTWEVILEASSDLVNWTPVAPGDYPSSTPQRYFRTRLVKRE